MTTSIPGVCRLAIPLLVLFSVLAGCSQESAGKLGRRTVSIAELPEPVIGAAKKELPDVEFSDAWKNLGKDGTLHSYEVRGKNKNGKTREVRVSPTGEILELE